QSRGFDINLVNKSTFSLSSTSLNRHIARAYNSGTGVTFGDGYVETKNACIYYFWFLLPLKLQGRQEKDGFRDPRSKDIEDVLILSGDHLYRMDYMDFVQNYRESGADITLSCLPMDDRRRPKSNDTTVLGLSKEEAVKKPYIASMGVYVFKKEILLNLLRWRFPTTNDFGSEVIPASAKEFYMKSKCFNERNYLIKSCHQKSNNGRKVKIGVGVGVSVGVLCGLLLAFCLIWKRRKRATQKETNAALKDQSKEEQEEDPEVPLYDLSVIASSTDN
ncbi:hypothetical protein S245_017163, partial [Arachis hypogaea]